MKKLKRFLEAFDLIQLLIRHHLGLKIITWSLESQQNLNVVICPLHNSKTAIRHKRL